MSDFKVYNDRYFAAEKVLHGLKGHTYLEPGFVHAPYIPDVMAKPIYKELKKAGLSVRRMEFAHRKGIMTRYSKKLVKEEFYGDISICA